jgi:hypothetical protein
MTDNSNANAPNLDKELGQGDDDANDNQSGTTRRKNFEKAHGEDKPSQKPSGGPPRDDSAPPPDRGGPVREPLPEPTNNPTRTS